jgi:zinc-ribbon family
MFFIWGTRRTTRALGQIAYACSGCQRQTAYTAFTVETRLTIFFIPTIRLSKRYEVVCNVCGRRLRAVDDLARQLGNWERTGSLNTEAALSA